MNEEKKLSSAATSGQKLNNQEDEEPIPNERDDLDKLN